MKINTLTKNALVCLMAIICCGSSQETEPPVKKPISLSQKDQAGKEWKLPIKETATETLSLEITIPQHFKLLGFPCRDSSLVSAKYMPSQDKDPSLWSELICLYFHLQDPSLSQYLKKVSSGWKNRKKDRLDLKTSFERSDGVPIGYLTVDYPARRYEPGGSGGLIPGTNELIMEKVVEGEGGMVIIQYQTRYPSTISPADKKKLVQKIQDYFKTCKFTKKSKTLSI